MKAQKEREKKMERGKSEYGVKYFIVKPEGTTEPFDLFAIRIFGSDNRAYAEIHERRSSAIDATVDDMPDIEDFSDEITINLMKKWDGCSEIEIDEHYCGNIAYVADKIAIMIKAGSYMCDQFMADENYMHDTREQALAFLNCGDGADENPGIKLLEVTQEWKK